MLPSSPALPLSPDLLRLFLVLCQLCMTLLAVFYLRRRSLSLPAYLKWGLFAILVPLIGPFLVIYTRPGREHPPRMRRFPLIAPDPTEKHSL